MSSDIRISVLLATYNGESHLREQLDSILGQTGPEFSIYISDDGSTDSTPRLLQDFAEQYPSKIHLLAPNAYEHGAASNFLNLLQNVDSDLYLFADQDDIWTSDHIQSLYEKYQSLNNFEKSRPALVFSDMKIIHANGRFAAESFLDEEHLPSDVQKSHFYFVQNNVSGCVSLFNQALKKYVLKDPDLLRKNLSKVPMHDFFLSTTTAFFGKILFVKKALSLYRMHENNTLGVQNVTSGDHILKRLKQQSADMNRAMQYAGFFADYFKEYLDKGNLRVLLRFSKLASESKIKRMLFLWCHGFLKFGFLRKCVQLWNA